MKSFFVPEVKPFMAALLQGDLFSRWDFHGGELNIACKITLQGNRNPDFLSENETPFLTWPEIQGKIRSLILGGPTPSMMRLTLAVSADKLPDVTRDWLDAFVLNIQFESGKLFLITGIATNTFSMDKEPERYWDNYVPKYFQKHGILLTTEM